VIGDAPHSAITNVPGWETEDEQYFLLQLAQAVPEGGTIVEIGAEYGMSASIFIHGTNLSHHIYSVDLFPGDMLDKHIANLAEAGLAGRSQQIRGDSMIAGKQWDPEHMPIDLLFIDGDHSYRGASEDAAVWTPYVTVGGVVAFHDCACATNRMPHLMHFEVARAVSEWFFQQAGAWQILNSVNTLIAFRRVR
jgi:predicted O-methyltransferase YrrM